MNKNIREKTWKKGEHESNDGFKCKLSELSDQHLQNMIRKYKGSHDVTPLQSELMNRV